MKGLGAANPCTRRLRSFLFRTTTNSYPFLESLPQTYPQQTDKQKWPNILASDDGLSGNEDAGASTGGVGAGGQLRGNYLLEGVLEVEERLASHRSIL